MLQRPDPTRRATWLGLLEPFQDPSPATTPPMHPFGTDDPAVAAWRWCLTAGEPAAFAAIPGRRQGGDGPRPMLAPRDDLAIEVWTECELAVLHAGFRRLVELGVELGVEPGVESGLDPTEGRVVRREACEGGPTATDRLVRDLRDAVAWHLEHTQPDNATTHPWGLHAILELGRPTADAIDHAGSMLHAMQAAAVMTPDGRPDAISRWIVTDLVRTLHRLGPGEVGTSFGTPGS